VEKITPLQGMGYGVYMTLKTDTDTMPVHLGPWSLWRKQLIQFHSGDVVEVTGSQVSCDGKPAFWRPS